MKKMIKNLMLVAVAAMAFTACSEVSVEVDSLVKKTAINGLASIETDDTRSGFVGSETDENGTTVYKSAWDGGENIKIFNDSQELTTTIDAEGKFTAELEGTPSFITVCSPAEAWVSNYTCNIPAEQTPRENSVDPAAHILQAQNTPVSDGSVNAKMAHQVGYGKMTVNTPEGFAIDYVEIALNGSWDGFDKALTYKINADNVEGNVFWFASDVVEVSNFTVTAYNAEGNAYTKSVTIPEDRELKFQYGRVSTFSVSELEKYVAPAAPAFTSATYNGNSSDKVIKLYSDVLGELWINFYGTNSLLTSGNWVNEGQYGKDNGLYFGQNYGQYKPVGHSYYLTAAPTSFTLDVSIVDNMYKFIVNADYSNQVDGVTLVNAVYHGDIEGLDYPDLRTQLATPAVEIPVANGKEITLKWSAVKGADGYYVYCSQDNTINTTTTELTATFTMPAYSTTYNFYIKAIANKDNADYRDSDETHFQTAETGKDPNKLADYVMDSIVWDSSYFKLTNSDNYTSYVRLFFNESDRPGNNSIKVGEYTGCSTQNPSANQFGARVGWDSLTIDSYATFSSSATVVVSFENNEYKIILTYANGTTIGYKGMPDGWEAPEFSDNDNTGGEDGGDEPETPTDGVGSSIDNPYIYTSCVYTTSTGYYKYIFTGDGVYQLNLESNLQSPATSFPAIATDSKFGNAENEYYFAGTSYTGGSLDIDKTEITTEDLGGGIYRFSLKLVLQDGNIHYAKYEGTISSL